MTSIERMARLAAPTGRRRRVTSSGDGDPCPLEPGHGRMYVMRTVAGKEPQQYCPTQLHDGSKTVPVSRSKWPADVVDGQLVELGLQERERLASRSNEAP